MTHPAIKAAVEALEKADQDWTKEHKRVCYGLGLTNVLNDKSPYAEALTALRQLEGCIVIERGELPEDLADILDKDMPDSARDLCTLLATKAEGGDDVS